MTWGIFFGLAGLGLGLWQLLANKGNQSSVPVPPGAARPTAGLAKTRAEIQARAALCGMTYGDVRDAQRWVEKYLGQGVDLVGGLQIMQNTVAYADWPRSAKKAHCVYLNGPVPPPLPPSVGRQVEDAIFPRYGG